MGMTPPTEAGFMDAVVRLFRLYGWEVYHTLDSRGSEEGFPDLVIRRDPEVYELALIVAETKKEGEKPTKAQEAWLKVFTSVKVPSYVWTPKNWPQIERLAASEGAKPCLSKATMTAAQVRKMFNLNKPPKRSGKSNSPTGGYLS